MNFISSHKVLFVSLFFIFPPSFLLLNCNVSQAEQQDAITYIWITVDTESTDYWPLTDQVDTNIDGVSCGISEIITICDKYSAKATFFLNVYEHKKFSKKKLREIAYKIHKRGHDIQLHPHPEYAYDKNKWALWQYSLEEQNKIIGDGRELIFQWTGTYPIAFRAGGYFADNNTLKALTANNFLIDSSFFFQHPNCKINNALLEINSPKKIDTLWEIPVSLYQRKETPRHNVFGLKPVERYRKIDIDWASYNDLKSSIQQAQQNGLKIITLFLHSFSFLGETEKKPSTEDIKKFDNILSFIRDNKNLQIITSEELKQVLEKDGSSISAGKDFVPEIKADISFLKYVKRSYLGTLSPLYFAASVLGLLLVLSWKFVANRAKRNE